MGFIRKTLVLVHRYLGILLSIPILIWFVSGIAMIYARGMPSLSADQRREHLPVLDAGRILVSPHEAFGKTEWGGNPDEAQLTSILGRPAYRFSSSTTVTVFADTGELLEMNSENATKAAAAFSGIPRERLGVPELLESHDQWTITERPPLPLYKFALSDAVGSELYVSQSSGEVTVWTTRGSRALAWVAAIPHWLYFRALRANGPLWRRVVLWTSGLGTVSSLVGLVLAVIQYRRKRPHIPYAGWLRWHYITGVLFGVFTVTWLFSGFLSMEPWYWASAGGLGAGMREALAGGQLELERFTSPLPAMDGVKEVDYLVVQGAPYYRLWKQQGPAVLMSVETLTVRSEPFSPESLVERLKKPNPDIPVLESSLLDDYDSYYYAFERKAPLPALRVKFGDPDESWFYVDPRMSEIVGRATRKERLQRWIYHGFHSLDFSFWYYSRPAWDVGVIALCAGGTVLSGIGVVISWKRVTRGARRILRRKS